MKIPHIIKASVLGHYTYDSTCTTQGTNIIQPKQQKYYHYNTTEI